MKLHFKYPYSETDENGFRNHLRKLRYKVTEHRVYLRSIQQETLCVCVCVCVCYTGIRFIVSS
jgi:hypothetical protein